MSRTRVIARYDPRGVYALTAALALLLGPAGGWFVLFGPSIPNVPEWIPEIATVFAAPAIFIAAFASRCQRPRRVLLTGLLFGFTYWLSFIIAQDLVQTTSGGAQMLSGMWVGFLLAAAVLGALAGLSGLLVRWLVRFLLVTFVEQTGRLCPRCAYPTDPTTQPACPECGGPTALHQPHRLLAPASRAARRFARPALAAILLIHFAIAAAMIARRGYPIYRFQSSLAHDATARPGGFIAGTKPGGAIIETWAAGVWIPFPGSPSRGVIAAYLPEDQPGLPAVQLRVANRLGPRSFAEATFPVRSSLNRDQAEFIIRHGVPESLLIALQDASIGPPGAPATCNAADIDPAPHFPR